MKVHKWKTPQRKTECGRDWLEVVVDWRWKNVDCAKCLKKKPTRKGGES